MKTVGLILRTCLRFFKLVLRNPSISAGISLFGLGFALIAANAVFHQSGMHPAPLWKIEADSGRDNPHPIHTDRLVETWSAITGNVLTQTISLKNIPVPSIKPMHVSSSHSQKLVRELQAELTKIDLYSGKIDGIVGTATKKAIVDYQTSAGLLPDGRASYEILNSVRATNIAASNRLKDKPEVDPAFSIERPANNQIDREAIIRIQSGLKDRFGEQDIVVDGIFGEQTQEAIKRFQALFGIDPSGELNWKTIEKMVSSGLITAI